MHLCVWEGLGGGGRGERAGCTGAPRVKKEGKNEEKKWKERGGKL